MRLHHLVIDVAPLRSSRDFRFLFAARVVSLLGLGLSTVALPVQVYGLTGSSLQVAGVAAVLGGSALLATLAGGVLADRYDRRRLILLARGTAAGVFAVLALNAALPEPQLWVVYACAAVNGGTAVSNAALTAATPALVGRERLVAAGALVALSVEIGAVVGPTLAGVVVAGPGLATGYALTSAASVVTVLLVARIRPLPPEPAGKGMAQVGRGVRDGAAFVVRDRTVGGLLLVDVFALVFALPYVLFPQLADEVFGGGPAVVGLLYSAPPAGALLAALVSGWTGHVRRAGRALVALVAVYAVAVLGFGACALLVERGAVAPVAGLVAGVGALAVAGAARMSSDVLRRGLLQAHTPDHLQGRVSSAWLAQVMLSPTVGGVQAGLAARLLGPALGITVGAVVCLAGTAVAALALPAVRRATLPVRR